MGTDVLGTARIIVVADTSGFEEKLAADTQGGLKNFEEDAADSGALAGQNIRQGVTDETGKLEKDLGEDGAAAGASLRTGVTDETGKLADDVGKDGERAGQSLGQGVEKGGSGIKSTLSSFGVPESLLSGWAGAGIAVAAVGGIAIDMGEKFQSAETAISVASGTTIGAADKIGQAFLATAGSSEFSGTEMAKAFASVAGQLKSTEGAALNTSQAMQVMSAAGDLATATQSDLASTTQTVAGVMQAFQMSTKQASGVADVLFTASQATGQSVDSLGSALDKARARMGAFGPPVGQLASLLVDMTNHGETGRAAMTALGSVFTGLITPIGALTTAQKATQAEQEKFGVTFETAGGKMKSVGAIIAEVAPIIHGMGNAQAVATLTALGFGSASSKLLDVIKAGPAVYNATQAAVTKAGAAHEAAAKQAATLHVEMKTLEATFDDFETSLGTVLVPLLSGVLGLFMKAAAPILGMANALTKSKVAMDVLGAVIGGLILTKLAMMTAGLFAEGAEATATSAAVEAGGLRQMASFVAAAASKVASGVVIIASYVAQAAAATAAFVAENLATLGIIAGIALLVAAIVLLATHWSQVWSAIVSAATAAYNAINGAVLQPLMAAFQVVIDFIKAHWALLLGILTGPIGLAVALIYTYWSQISSAASTCVTAVTNFFGTLRTKISSAVSGIPGDFLTLGENIVNAIVKGIESMPGAIDNAITSMIPHGHISVAGISIPYAEGGVVSSPTHALLGEAGPEVVIPKSKVSSGTWGMLTGGSTAFAEGSLTAAQIQSVDAIMSVFKRYGLNPAAGIAIALNESNLSTTAVGDQGRSVGLFQENAGYGTVAQRENPTYNAEVAARADVAAGGRGLSARALQLLQVKTFERPQSPVADDSPANLRRAEAIVAETSGTISLTSALGESTKAALAHAAALIKDAAASINFWTKVGTDEANAHAQAITDAGKVAADKLAAHGLTGTALTAANAQTTLDVGTQRDDAAVARAQLIVDKDANKNAKVQAEAARNLARAQDKLAIDTATNTVALNRATAANTAAGAAGSTPGAGMTVNINGTGMSPQGIMTEISWALTTGAIPAAA